MYETFNFQYVKNLDPDAMGSEEFGLLMKSQPSLILFVPMNAKEIHEDILHTVCGVRKTSILNLFEKNSYIDL